MMRRKSAVLLTLALTLLVLAAAVVTRAFADRRLYVIPEPPAVAAYYPTVIPRAPAVAATEPSIPDVPATPEPTYTAAELEMLACVIYQEAGSNWCSDDMQLAVGNVVLDRVASPDWPDTVEEVLTQYPKIKGIYITGSGVLGVCEAIKTASRSADIKIIANDFIQENIYWLMEGTINFLIGQDAYTQGYQSVMVLFRKLFDNKEPEKDCLYTEIVIKNKYNI